jgi:hypothetical protein
MYTFIENYSGNVVFCYDSDDIGFYNPIKNIDEPDFLKEGFSELEEMVEKLKTMDKDDYKYPDLLEEFYKEALKLEASEYIENCTVHRGFITVPYSDGVEFRF